MLLNQPCAISPEPHGSKQSELEQSAISERKTMRNILIDSIRKKMQKMPILRKNVDMVEQVLAKRAKQQAENEEQEKSASFGMDSFIKRDSSEYSDTDLEQCIDGNFPRSISIENIPSLYSDKSSQGNSFQNSYTLHSKIGQGSNGVVYICEEKKTHKIYAVKSMALDDEHLYFLKDNFLLLRNIQHSNIIEYQSLYFDHVKNISYLVMEYFPHASLIAHAETLQEDQLKLIMYELFNTLCYLHQLKICHRDIKPENVLYDRVNRKIKLIDFGISKKCYIRNLPREMLTLTGTLYYRAPEMFEGGGYDERVDLWAAGVLMYRLMTGATPFESQYHSDTITNILKGQFRFPESVEEEYSRMATSLVGRLLKNRKARLSAVQAKNDIWFMQLRDQQSEFTKSASFRERKDGPFRDYNMFMLNCSYSCFGDLKKRFEESESKGANVNELNHQKTDKGTEINTELTAVQKINLLKLAKPETNIFERATEVHY